MCWVLRSLTWNLRKAGFAEGELCDLNGSISVCCDARLRNNDPRLSIAERYLKEGDRGVATAKAAKQLVQDRLMLEEDEKLFTAPIK